MKIKKNLSDEEMFKGYENVHVFYGVGDYDKKYKNCYDYNKRDDFKYKNAILTSEGAIALYKKCGFEAEGILKNEICIDGRFSNLVYMGLMI